MTKWIERGKNAFRNFKSSFQLIASKIQQVPFQLSITNAHKVINRALDSIYLLYAWKIFCRRYFCMFVENVHLIVHSDNELCFLPGIKKKSMRFRIGPEVRFTLQTQRNEQHQENVVIFLQQNILAYTYLPRGIVKNVECHLFLLK